ncbi:hypothetical protein PRNP1_009599 [Phytophthora ramorum]
MTIQQQADDRTYVDTSFKMEQAPTVVNDEKNLSFRLTLSRPGGFMVQSQEVWSGWKKLVQEPRGHMPTASEASGKSGAMWSGTDDASRRATLPYVRHTTRNTRH